MLKQRLVEAVVETDAAAFVVLFHVEHASEPGLPLQTARPVKTRPTSQTRKTLAAWTISDSQYAANGEIEGYASATSVNRGGSINLFVKVADLGLAGREPREVLPQIRQTLVGLSDPAERSADATSARRGAFGPDTRVRHLIGLDPGRGGGGEAPAGRRLRRQSTIRRR